MRTPAPFILLACLAVACTPTPTPTPVAAVPSATLTALPPSTTVAPPTMPPTATETPRPTATERPTRTPRPPTATHTHTPVASPTSPPPTAVPATTVPSATATAARADAPVLGGTWIEPWNTADFRKELGELLTNTQIYRNDLQRVLTGGVSSCRALYIYTDEMFYGQRGYSYVPDSWYAAYYEYRVMINDSFSALAPIAGKCRRGAAPFDDQYDAQQAAAALPILDTIITRAPQILNDTAGLP